MPRRALSERLDEQVNVLAKALSASPEFVTDAAERFQARKDAHTKLDFVLDSLKRQIEREREQY